MKRKKNLDNALDFLTSSIDAATGGSAAYFSRLYKPLSGWSAPYPETTGYLIPTFLEVANQQEGYQHLIAPSLKMADWVVSLQEADGSLPGGVYKKGTHEGSVFNTAQMIIGLVAAYQHTQKEQYLETAKKAATWLAKNQNPDGSWSKHSYYEDFFPSYYTRVAWPMLLVNDLVKDREVVTAALKTFDLITSKKQKNHFIKDAGFQPNQYAFLHTIAYTIRGFLEAFFLTQQVRYWNAAYDWAHKLFRRYELKKQLAGAYYEDFKGITDYRCLTGEAQMVIIWLKIFETTEDLRFVNASSKLLDDICKTQPLHNSLLLKKGGLKGSHPYHGRYLTFRQPNWATKFFVDALLLETQALQKISNINAEVNRVSKI